MNSLDWPIGRAVIMDKNLKYGVLVNKEEHFEIIFNKNKNIDFFEVFL